MTEDTDREILSVDPDIPSNVSESAISDTLIRALLVFCSKKTCYMLCALEIDNRFNKESKRNY